MGWDEAIEQFRSYMMLERSLSPHTAEAYVRDVRKLVEYLNITGQEGAPEHVQTDVLYAFVRYIADMGLEASSQARIVSGIRAFYKLLLTDDIVSSDPTEQIEVPVHSRKMPIVLSVAEVERMMQTIDLSAPLGLRNRAMMEVLYACGLRVSELTALVLGNLFLDDGFIRVFGKNSKERLVPIGGIAIRMLKQYLEHGRPIPSKKSEPIVFLNRRGGQMTRVMVFYLVRQIAAAAGIEKQISPHTFRHTFATHLVEGGADLKAVQDMLGHESITTTEIYTHLDAEYLRGTILMYHPRMKWGDRP
jgi:integrase/recombinase XerD